MDVIRIALLGYGTVGKGVHQTIQLQQERLQTLLGKRVELAGVLVKNINKHHIEDSSVLLTDNCEELFSLGNIHVVIDAIVGREPGFSYLKRAIQNGTHIITANKELFAHHGRELKSLADEKGVSIGYEATVGAGIPIIQTLSKLLQVNKVKRIQGILNGTSNFILSSMREKGLSFQEALKEAQEKGYAESDPGNDIEGRDAYFKALVLSDLAYGKKPEEEHTLLKGITDITIEQINYFSSLNLRFKHVAEIVKAPGKISCAVRPVLVSPEHPLYQVEYEQNAIAVETTIAGRITLQGLGAGMYPTASAVIEDLVQLENQHSQPVWREDVHLEAEEIEQSLWILPIRLEKQLKDKKKILGKLGSKCLIAKNLDEESLELRDHALEVLGGIDLPQIQGLQKSVKIS
ncbi:homoserine dehydrogenase [Bacillus lacus]|uniref:Homoserine dehydrogenase n=1 Tax=Metabacillus lacus TaxID=1983721 RepID=A0A7X2LZ62_9BACI|nr:homoserine dehydrogenase [Metabacillus lacus]MRX73086.1 homoserine dehydrogenase [Metabacillus lacus]